MTLLWILGITSILYVYRSFVAGFLRRKSLRDYHRCAAIPTWPVRDRWLGLDFFWHHLQAFHSHRLLDALDRDFSIVGAPTFQVRMGGDHLIVTCDPENLQHVISTNSEAFRFGHRRQSAFQSFHGDGVFTLEGRPWQQSRRIVQQSLYHSRSSALGVIERSYRHHVDQLPPGGGEVDMQAFFHSLTFDVTSHFLWGRRMDAAGSRKGGTVQAFDDVSFRAQEGTGRRLNYGWFKHLLTPVRYWSDVKQVQETIDAWNQHGLTSGLSLTETYLGLLSTHTNDRDVQRDGVLQLLLAARDTTAALLNNLWFELGRHPEALRQVRDEVDRLGSDPPDHASIQALRYTKACMSETLRLYPPIPYNLREAAQDVVLPRGGGVAGRQPALVPRGALVVWNLYSLHRRKDIYGDDAHQFRPSRWLDDAVTDPRWAFLPFHGGPRVCPGASRALTEAAYVTVRLCQDFSVLEASNHARWVEKLSLTCTNRTENILRVRRR